MSRLPVAPASQRHGGVEVVFDCFTAGDDARGFVPGYRFRILNREAVEVGRLSVRIGDTDHVRFAAGEIGYEVAESHRGNGHARDACLAVAAWIAAQLAETVLITVDPGNVASIRTVLAIGARYLDEVDVPRGDPHYLRGSHRKRRYQWRPAQCG